MANKKYLITGITGFVGSHLANLLIEKGENVYGLFRGESSPELFCDIVPTSNREKINILRGDIRNKQDIDAIFKTEKFDGVFHFAAQSNSPLSVKEPVQTFEINTGGTVNLIDAIRRFQPECAFVYASSGEVYGKVLETQQPITEKTALAPNTPYGVSKLASEIVLKERANSLGLKIIIGRGFATVGSGRPKEFSISSDAYQITRIAKGLQERVIGIGNIKSKRGLLDIRDCVSAYYLLMEAIIKEPSLKGESYNIASEFSNELETYLDIMIKMKDLEGRIEKRIDPSKLRSGTAPSVQLCNIDKIKALTGWQPTISMTQTLRDLLNYWDKKIVN
jgi:GDP-4-dehydro-6-deoxy-D-mannose reductase